MWIPCFIPLYSPLNLYLIILWILDFKYILLLLLLLLSGLVSDLLFDQYKMRLTLHDQASLNSKYLDISEHAHNGTRL